MNVALMAAAADPLATFQLGPEELLVGAKVELDPALSFAEVA